MNWFEKFGSDPDLAEFTPVAENGVRMLIRRDYVNSAPELGLLGGTARVVDRTGGGRGAHPVVELSSGERVLVRDYRRGGAMRHLNYATYFMRYRALEELRTTAAAANRGLSVAQVIAAIERRAGFGYTAAIATRWIEGATELASWLVTAEPDNSLTVLRAAGGEIARMHRVGIAHPDLNLRNLLVGGSATEKPATVTLIDFDRAVLGESAVGRKRRERDLRRLFRSARKLAAPIETAGWNAFRAGYGSTWPLTDSLE